MKQYTIDELHVGMTVRREELSNIYGVWIFFDNYVPYQGGTIICITKERNSDEAIRIMRGRRTLSVFYQDPDLCNSGVAIYG